jgi:hypothetical protein
VNEFLRDRIMRKLETLSDERLYQVLDYVEFLESRYAERSAPGSNVFQRFAEGVEDSLRAGRVSASAVSETMNLMSKAMGVLQGVAAAGKSMANEVVSASARPSGGSTGTGTAGGATGGAGGGSGGPQRGTGTASAPGGSGSPQRGTGDASAPGASSHGRADGSGEGGAGASGAAPDSPASGGTAS